MNTNKKFTDNSLDVLQKINLSMEIDNIEEIIKKETLKEIKKINKKEIIEKGLLKTFKKKK